jgi:hypothetical protein
MISDGATNQSTNTKKVKNTSQSSGNKAKLKKLTLKVSNEK